MTTMYVKPLLYIAGPYSSGDQIVNSRNAIDWGQEFWETGLVTPIIPHLNIAWHLAFLHPLEYWYTYDLALLAHCHALFRIKGVSLGADAEVAEAQKLGLPVFHDPVAVTRWARERQNRSYRRADDRQETRSAQKSTQGGQ